MAQNLQAAFDALDSPLPTEVERKTALLLGTQEDLKPLTRELLSNGQLSITDEDGNVITINREELAHIRFRLVGLRNYQVEMRQFARRDTFRRIVSVARQSEFF